MAEEHVAVMGMFRGILKVKGTVSLLSRFGDGLECHDYGTA